MRNLCFLYGPLLHFIDWFLWESLNAYRINLYYFVDLPLLLLTAFSVLNEVTFWSNKLNGGNLITLFHCNDICKYKFYRKEIKYQTTIGLLGQNGLSVNTIW